MSKVKRKPKLTPFEKVESFFNKNDKIFFIIILVLSVFVSLLLFDVKVSLLGDDSAYLIRANKFLKEGVYPTFQGPLYPVVLAGFIYILGFNVVLMKFLSLLFITGFFILTYIVFKKFIPQTALVIVLLILAINPNLLYYSSQTYSEALFLFLTSLYFFAFYYLTNRFEHNNTNTNRIINWIILGFILFLLSITKNLGISFVISTILFFLSYKQYRNAIYSFISFLIFTIPYQLILFITINTGSLLGGQITGVLYKNPYNYSEGYDSFSDILGRFAENSKVFLSIHFLQSIGINVTPGYFPVFVILLIVVIALAISYKNHKFLFFVGLFLIVIMLNTFVIQTLWNIQLRFIIPFFPYLLLFLGFGLFELCAKFLRNKGRLWITGVLVVILFSAGKISLDRISKNIPVINANLSGDLYFGYPENWINYLKMCKWTSENLLEDAIVVCRKPNLGSIYSNGKEFEGMYRLPSRDPDSLLKVLSEKQIQYIIRANLKGKVYNTIPELLNIIHTKYPDKFIVIEQIGETDPAYLVEVKN